MSYYIIVYSTDNQQTWLTASVSYSGSVSLPYLNEILAVSGSGNTKAYFKTYLTGSVAGSIGSETTDYLIGGANISFTSYYSIHEHKYVCVVNRGEFNSTSNPSLYDISGSIKEEIVQTDTSGSLITTIRDENFHTFTTGIGLYDDSLQLVAYAKFANPIRIEKDLDSVFIVKFDI